MDTDTKAKTQHLRSWNPAEDAPGFGDTEEEEESEDEKRKEVTLRTNEESRLRKHDEEDSGRKKVPRPSAETRPPRLPAKGAYGEEPLGNMKRPTGKKFKFFSHMQPLVDAETRETFEELVTRTAVTTLRQEEK